MQGSDSHQAGGGVSGDATSVPTLNPTLSRYVNAVFNSHADKNTGKWSKDQIATFLRVVQGDYGTEPPSALLKQSDLDRDGFVSYMLSPESSIVGPAKDQDLSWPLASYFISSSHNTYLTGNQLYSLSSTEAYTNVLRRGCRCIEVDVWDGDASDTEVSSISSDDDDPEKYAKRKERVSQLKDKIPKSLTSRFRESSLAKRLGQFVDSKTEPKQPPASASNVQSSGGLSPSPLTRGGHEVSTNDQNPSALQKTQTQDVQVIEPKVYHGYTLTKEVSFRDVCYAIRDDAFTASDLPLIVSLEVHCGPEQQLCMVDIMEEAFHGYLVPRPAEDAVVLPAPENLRNKILIKVKYAPPVDAADVVGSSPSPAENVQDGAVQAATDSATSIPLSSTSETLSPSTTSPTSDAPKKKKKSKIIQKLSDMGIFTRGISFKSLTQPEAVMPTHIFSVSEKAVLDLHEKYAQELFEHNRHYLMRTYPSGMRIGSSNLDPVVFWRKGIQIVALNWQNWDEGMMLNEGMFAGTKGYLLKPEGYRGSKLAATSTSTQGQTQTTAVRHRTLDLAVEVFAAQNIPLPTGDEKVKSFRPYIKCELHVEEPGERHGGANAVPHNGREKEGEFKARTKTIKGTVDPDYGGEILNFSAIEGVVEELSFLRFTVRDDELGRDDLAAWACVRLDRLRTGYRIIRLLDGKGMESDGLVLVKISKRIYDC
ncbi:hypothetical protein PpBr36_03716 [Pyricularia pennisetigena]|uniref:hypothetical protein n=1 Tax=Pyricularia pennisetigena TaxID=1578925 RepID=UPI00114D80B8|nr:hypothetical protein PpBr36_03716 [Pyricularia pennisetigena]TLS30095.1 hypothetical protein PpBr36_03716 [Pyricularia pennisetigena]